MKQTSSEFRALLGYSKEYGIQFGPYEDRRFPFITRLGLRVGVPIGMGLLTLAYDTSRIATIGDEMLDELLSEGKGIIYAHWHHYAQFYFFWARHKRHVIMSSPKESGEYGARCMARVGILTARGSTSSRPTTGRFHDKKGKEALAAMVRLVRDEGYHAGLTVDGPRGPALTLRMGAVTLAKETGSPIVVMTAAARPHARLSTWDKMWVPLPLSRIVYFFTGPFFVPRDADKERLEAIRAEIEAHMREMAHKAERYFSDKAIRRRFPAPASGGRS